MTYHKGPMKNWRKSCFSFPLKDRNLKKCLVTTLPVLPELPTMTLIDNLKLQFLFSAGKANAESYALSTGATYALLLNVDTGSHSEHEQFV